MKQNTSLTAGNTHTTTNLFFFRRKSLHHHITNTNTETQLSPTTHADRHRPNHPSASCFHLIIHLTAHDTTRTTTSKENNDSAYNKQQTTKQKTPMQHLYNKTHN
eukprot:GDKK01076359.1.p2 GENE.GDKK01076359.1~~GDKK01076359.1.p2  ORF type:complete len:105 (+),score=13.05 GDKK01076359.1:99-413(+)